jgi:3-oxoacyl-[acyl-carrier protein] reductase
MADLSGKTALVTGATRGIGRAIAERLMSDGAEVTGTGTTANGAVPAGCAYRCADFSDAAATRAFAQEVAAIGFDILVNNAGINVIGHFEEIDPADFTRVQQINVTAPYLLCQAVVPAMKEKGWGRIVNIGSVWGKFGKELRSPYATSKFAIAGMTAVLAGEVTEFGILANCVSPGITETELTRTILNEQQIAGLVAQIPAGRIAQPAEIAAAVAWLAGPENTYISGQHLAVDGGLTRV